jgi:hypothetical protein
MGGHAVGGACDVKSTGWGAMGQFRAISLLAMFLLFDARPRHPIKSEATQQRQVFCVLHA